jgi:amidase
MDSIDLAFTSALEQADLIRTKQLSPVELTQLYLDRIEKLDPQLGSFFTVTAELALSDAQAKTEILSQGSEDLPPFFGVPIAIKDLNPVKGIPCSFGVKALRKFTLDVDDAIVTKLKQAGFILLGKTATSQLGSFPYTEPPGFPPTRNPWNLDYTAGGSSGGSAAAMAAGLTAIAQGSDGGGSVRGPASCCGLVGLKPSRGRISSAPIGESLAGFAANGPIARTVADAAAFLDVTAGYITGDPYWLPLPETSFLEAIKNPPQSLRIGMVGEIEPVGTVDPILMHAVEKTARSLEDLGHSIEPVVPDFRAIVEPFVIVWRTQTDVGLPPFLLEKVNRSLWMRARFTRAARYVKAVQQLHSFGRKVVGMFDNFDVLLLPTFMHPAIKIGEWKHLSSMTTVNKIIEWIAPCPAFNVSGQPAITVPAGFDPNGVPLGIQLVGRPGDEVTILSLAAQLEAAQPWIQHRPTFAIDD